MQRRDEQDDGLAQRRVPNERTIANCRCAPGTVAGAALTEFNSIRFGSCTYILLPTLRSATRRSELQTSVSPFRIRLRGFQNARKRTGASGSSSHQRE